MMGQLVINSPVVQVAIDVLNIGDALRIAEAAVKAGVDWLECGTPLITFAGTTCIGAMSREFPGIPILADYKCMDGARKYALETKAQGGSLCTVCAQAADATVRTMVAAGQETGVSIVCDLINSPDVDARAAEVEALGVESVYIHWGSDQKSENPNRDPQLDLRAVVERVRVPIGIATFNAEDGVRAIEQGAKIVVIGFPVIGHADVEGALREYVEAVRSAWED